MSSDMLDPLRFDVCQGDQKDVCITIGIYLGPEIGSHKYSIFFQVRYLVFDEVNFAMVFWPIFDQCGR